jgi:hypothetical protein
MTETGLGTSNGGFFCPDASTKHRDLVVEQKKGSTSKVPEVWAPRPELTANEAAKAALPDLADTGDTVSATWGEEKITVPDNIARFCTFTVGPFSASTKIRQGETRQAALGRLNNDLAAMAEEARLAKMQSYTHALKEMGITLGASK